MHIQVTLIFSNIDIYNISGFSDGSYTYSGVPSADSFYHICYHYSSSDYYSDFHLSNSSLGMKYAIQIIF